LAQGDIDNILDFWFGELNRWGMPVNDRNALWFGYQQTTDQLIEQQFGELVASALAGKLNDWRQQPNGSIALVILLDQFTRNIFRGTARAFSGDPLALALSHALVTDKKDTLLPAIYRVFLYIPYEHSENIEHQRSAVALFDQLVKDSAEPIQEQIASFERYAQAHYKVINTFGRFPHRNTVLGRSSTKAELTHLEKHGGF